MTLYRWLKASLTLQYIQATVLAMNKELEPFFEVKEFKEDGQDVTRRVWQCPLAQGVFGTDFSLTLDTELHRLTRDALVGSTRA